jgi:phosphoglycerate dehydrogenase-like enzyme
MRHVHLLNPPAPAHYDHLRAALDANIVLSVGDDVPLTTQILVTGRPARHHLTPEVTALLIPFAGLPTETRALLHDFPGISVHNLHHNAPMTAEMAVTLLLAAAREIIPADRGLRSDDWTARYAENSAVILDGKTALILGYGAVGMRIARALDGLGMHVLATRRGIEAVARHSWATIYPASALDDLLPRAHVLLIALPDTPETTGLIGARELALLPRGAILVNVGRAAVVDQAALYDALLTRHLHSAGLDVWYRYPADEAARRATPPADHPFGALDNVVLSPHRGGGGGSDEVERRRMDALAASLNAAARGEPMPHRIDLERGY